MNQPAHKTNLVFFYSEGPPNDNALDLSVFKEQMFKHASGHVDDIAYYTPLKLRQLGHEWFVREFDDTGLATANRGMWKIAFSAWKPLIILLELEKLNEGDIVIYRDANIGKYPQLAVYEGLKEIAEQCLEIAGFDFFVAQHPFPIKNRQITKTNVLRELGEDHLFSYDFPTIMGNFVIARKSKISLQILNEWKDACAHTPWIDGQQYGDLDPEFIHSSNEQAILSTIVANWIRKRTHNIPLTYPLIAFEGRDIRKLKINRNFSYLKSLELSSAEYVPLPYYAENLNTKGLMHYIYAFFKLNYDRRLGQLQRLIARITKNKTR